MAKYELSREDAERLNEWHYHKPFGDQFERFDIINNETRNLAKLIMENCPYSRHRQSALTWLEMVRMFANAAIACNEKESDEIETH